MSELQATATIPFAAFIAIDWADRTHAFALKAESTTKIEKATLDSSPEAVDEWAMALFHRFAGRPIAVGLEQQRGAVVAILSKYAHLVLFPIAPSMLANYRASWAPSGAKSDPSDAALLLDILLKHRDRLKALCPDTVETRTLQLLTEDRRRMVDQITAWSNELTSKIKQVFPQLLKLFDDMKAPVVCDLLEKWPTLEKLQKASKATVEKFLVEHNCRDGARNEHRLEIISKSIPATKDQALLEATGMSIKHLTGMIRAVRSRIVCYDKRIHEIAQAHADYKIFAGFPGAGDVLIPRIIAAMGTKRDRFETAGDLQCYTGIAPVCQSSGKQHWVHWRWACSKFTRQTMQEMANHSIRFCGWAREYYDQQRAKEKGHHAAVRALAFKWLRILFRCWKDSVPYDEGRYLLARSKRGGGAAVEGTTKKQKAVKIKLKTCGDFKKLDGLGA